jgi:hypothetical protein
MMIRTAAVGIISGMKIITVTMSLVFVLSGVVYGEGMPVDQQNALVQKYCAVCHNEAKLMGGLSLQDFDAARPDPTVAGMMVTKLKGGAMGAARIPEPDEATVSSMISALTLESDGAKAATKGWTVEVIYDQARKLPLISASMVREIRSQSYELKVVCGKTADLTNQGIANKPGTIQLTTGAESAPFTYDSDGVSGRSSLGAGFVVPLPSKSLTVNNLRGETLTFPFDSLSPSVRRVLSTCIN